MRRWIFSRAFSLTELLILMVVLGVIASMAVASVQGYQDRTAMLIDETNQKMLFEAVKIHAIDTGTVAGTLSQLRPDDLEKAYVRVMERGRPYTFFAFLMDPLGVGTAEAEPLPSKYYNHDKKVLTCPVDPHNPLRGDGVSYAINGEFRGKPLSFLLRPENGTKDLIYECADDGNSQEFRHEGRKVSIVTTADGKHQKRAGGGGGQGAATSVGGPPRP
ncbi:MAG: type II secretion system protein [Candidatus Omnitrophica bacterium]|nr:type II secretion system protein [Candidatus Omnitrophota bacterium]